jgi:hypothetical protein
MRCSYFLVWICPLAIMSCPVATFPTYAELYINEIFFDPGGAGQDNRDEYIELRGTPGMSLADHYLIFVEHEDNEAHTGGAGLIENIFDLSGFSLGANGFLLLRQDGNLFNDDSVAPGATNIENDNMDPMLTLGWGDNNSSPGTSLVLHSGITNAGTRSISLENGGSTAVLIRNDISVDGGLVPRLELDLDQGNDGLDNRPDSPQTAIDDWASKWTILDSVGHLENDEIELARMYGQVNFAPDRVGEPVVPEDPFSPVLTPELLALRLEPGAEYVGLGFEIEYLGRWGNSTGYTSADWHVANLTDNPGSGSSGVVPTAMPPVIDFRQSGDPHPLDDADPSTPPTQPPTIESNKRVPYGTKLTATLGGPNYLTGDYNGNGEADAADYVVWRHTFGQTGSEKIHPAADANHDFLVDAADYESWRSRFGAPHSTHPATERSSVSLSTVPEPSSALIMATAVVTAATRCGRKRRQFSRCSLASASSPGRLTSEMGRFAAARLRLKA